MAFLEGSERLFPSSDVDNIQIMDISESYMGTLEVIHECDLLMVHGYNIDTYIDNVYSKEDVSASPDKQESLGERIWEGIKKFVSMVIDKLVQLYEWFIQLITNSSKEIDNLKDQVSKLDEVSVSRATMNKLDNVNRPHFGQLEFIRDSLHELIDLDVSTIVNVNFDNTGAMVSISHKSKKTIDAINEYSNVLQTALVQNTTAYGTGSNLTAKSITNILESSQQVLDDVKTFKNVNGNTVKDLKRILSMNSKPSALPAEVAKRNNKDITTMCRAVVGLFNVYTKSASKFLFTVIMIARTFIKASNAQTITT